MAASADAIARRAIAAVGVILLAIATQTRWAGQSALAAEAPPVAPAPSIVAGGGVTLHSVSVSFPNSDNTFPGGPGADAINNDCLICHSAGMVLDQASLSRAGWQGIVDQMRNDFKAPFAAEDDLGDRRLPRQPKKCNGSERRPPTRRQARRRDRRARHSSRRSALRPVPRLQWRLRCQRRVSAACRPIGLLSCGAAARLCLGRAGECHHVADRQGAVARRYRRCDGVLCERQCAVSAAQSARCRARQARRGARQGRRTREAALRQLPWTRRRGRAAGDPIPRADNTPTTSPSHCRCGRKVSARTVPTRWRRSPRSSTTKRSRRSPPTTSR